MKIYNNTPSKNQHPVTRLALLPELHLKHKIRTIRNFNLTKPQAIETLKQKFTELLSYLEEKSIRMTSKIIGGSIVWKRYCCGWKISKNKQDSFNIEVPNLLDKLKEYINSKFTADTLGVNFRNLSGTYCKKGGPDNTGYIHLHKNFDNLSDCYLL